jgi:signal transduction histidine kinase
MANVGHPCQPSTAHVAPKSFAQLVSLACHDLRTPLATASGFARTLERLEEIGQPAERYVEMIGAATDQLAELLDLLSAAARVELGRFEPQLRSTDTRELADAAAARLQDDRASVEGRGGEVRADPDWAVGSVAALAEAARRHGGLDRITIGVDGPEVFIAPVAGDAGAIALGDDLKDFAAAVGAVVLERGGVRLELDGERLRLTFPE